MNNEFYGYVKCFKCGKLELTCIELEREYDYIDREPDYKLACKTPNNWKDLGICLQCEDCSKSV